MLLSWDRSLNIFHYNLQDETHFTLQLSARIHTTRIFHMYHIIKRFSKQSLLHIFKPTNILYSGLHY